MNCKYRHKFDFFKFKVMHIEKAWTFFLLNEIEIYRVILLAKMSKQKPKSELWHVFYYILQTRLTAKYGTFHAITADGHFCLQIWLIELHTLNW